ncbi:MAG: beta-N-acetylglucosaminidase domain-containing protein [Clostridia bacterium]|nr:beta-N-acetylglucosaminidase domain-containing protein [Clostridia bacterium]MBQ7122968.1 beta-N-acetylglucosaminidase domain-containing protein [Clostridia bacterium]
MNEKSRPAVVFEKLFDNIANGYNIEIVYKDSEHVVYCKKTHRVIDEKYILSVSGKEVKIYCSCEKGAFRALCDLAKRIDENTVSDGEYICSPSFAVRGYIEGFYGTPWSHENRKSVMELMAKNRMNTVYYAPKDDLFHRDKWRENYPEDALTKLKELVDCASEYYMDFYWCIAPGLSMKYSGKTEFDALIEKTKQLYSIGITDFGLLLDDIDEELTFEEDKVAFDETVNAHIELINRYYSVLKEIDSSIRLTVCPTLYHGKGNEYYISKLGKNIPTLVSLFWTGRDICSRELTSPEAVRFIESTYHKPLYWDNYPVNDCSMYNEMHISPIINRDPDLYKYSEGIISNCMEYAECSKIPLITVADYLWDSENYDPQKSWESAIRQVVGKENAENFIVFADHLYTSCLKDANSRRMYESLDGIKEAFKSGNKEKAFALAENYLGKMNACRDYLKRDLPICREISKWSEKYFVSCDILNRIFEYIKTSDEKLISELLLLVEKYEAMPARISNDVNIREELKNLKNIN